MKAFRSEEGSGLLRWLMVHYLARNWMLSRRGWNATATISPIESCSTPAFGLQCAAGSESIITQDFLLMDSDICLLSLAVYIEEQCSYFCLPLNRNGHIARISILNDPERLEFRCVFFDETDVSLRFFARRIINQSAQSSAFETIHCSWGRWILKDPARFDTRHSLLDDFDILCQRTINQWNRSSGFEVKRWDGNGSWKILKDPERFETHWLKKSALLRHIRLRGLDKWNQLPASETDLYSRGILNDPKRIQASCHPPTHHRRFFFSRLSSRKLSIKAWGLQMDHCSRWILKDPERSQTLLWDEISFSLQTISTGRRSINATICYGFEMGRHSRAILNSPEKSWKMPIAIVGMGSIFLRDIFSLFISSFFFLARRLSINDASC